MIAEANRHLEGGRQEEALRTAIAARDLAPDSDNAWVGLANVYLKLGRKSDSLAALRRVIELNPAQRSELARNANFESLRQDPEFRKMTE
jgi:tetratricopeptide (TPR) repeat protein